RAAREGEVADAVDVAFALLLGDEPGVRIGLVNRPFLSPALGNDVLDLKRVVLDGDRLRLHRPFLEQPVYGTEHHPQALLVDAPCAVVATGRERFGDVVERRPLVAVGLGAERLDDGTAGACRRGPGSL